MNTPIPTPQQQILQTVKELLAQHRQETMAAVNALGQRLDDALANEVGNGQPDPQARQAWLRETALRSAVDLYRGTDGTMTGTRGDILAAAKAFEAFLGGTDATAA